jgi:lipopolysaccharide export system permease protein
VPKTFIREFRGAVVYVGDREGDRVRDIWVWRLDAESRVTEMLRADSGVIRFDDASNSLVFTPANAVVEHRNKNPEDFQTEIRSVTSAGTSLAFPLEKLFGQRVVNQKPDWLTLPVLLNEIENHKNPQAGGDDEARIKQLTKLRMVLQDKFSMGVAVLTFVFVAVPLGIKVSRRETSANLGIALLLALGYYFLTVVVKWLEGSPQIRPDLWLWLPNVIFVSLGLWLIRRVQRA